MLGTVARSAECRIGIACLLLVFVGCRSGPVAERAAEVLRVGAPHAEVERTLGRPVEEVQQNGRTRAVYAYHIVIKERVGYFKRVLEAVEGMGELAILFLPIALVLEPFHDPVREVRWEGRQLTVDYDEQGRVVSFNIPEMSPPVRPKPEKAKKREPFLPR